MEEQYTGLPVFFNKHNTDMVKTTSIMEGLITKINGFPSLFSPTPALFPKANFFLK